MTTLLRKFASSSMVEGATHIVSFSLLWKVKMCPRFAFSTSDTPHSKHWVRARNPVKPSTASLPEEELPTNDRDRQICKIHHAIKHECDVSDLLKAAALRYRTIV